jgi:hypothetical protein
MARNEQAKATIYLDGKQAEAALEGLKNRAVTLREELKKAKEAGNLELADKIKKDLSGVDSAINSSKKNLFDYEKVLKDLNGTSLNELTKAKTVLTRQVRSLTVGTKEWIAANENLSKVKGRISEVNAQMGLVQTPLQKVIGLAKGMLPAFGFAAIAAGAKLAFDKVVASTDTLSTQWAVFMGGMKGATDEFFRTLATGDWSNFMTNMRNAIEVGREYQRVLDDLEAKQRALSVAEADARMEMRTLEDTVRNVSLSNAERVAAAEKRIKLEETLQERRSQIAKQEYENELMVTEQASKLRKDELMQLVADFDSEQKIAAEKYQKKKDEYEKLKKLNVTTQGGGMFGGSIVPLEETDTMKALRLELEKTNTETVSYAESLQKLGNVTDEQLNKMVAAYEKLRGAEVSSLENTKRVRSAMYSIIDEENRKAATGSGKANQPSAPASGTPTNNQLPILAEIDLVADKEIEIDALKSMEADWTEYLNTEVNKQIDILARQFELEKEIADARIALKDMQVEAIGQLASTLAGMFEQGSAAQIAMIAIEKAIAIAQIWINYAREMSAISLASAQIAATPFIGPALGAAYYATMSAKAKSQAAINTGIVVAQVIAGAIGSNKSKGKRSGGFTNPYAGEDEITDFVHGKEWVASAPVVSNPATRKFIDVFEIAQRTGTIKNLSVPAIIGAVTGSSGKQSGGFSSDSPSSFLPEGGDSSRQAGSRGNSGINNKLIADLTTAINQFLQHKPPVYLEEFEKKWNAYNDTKTKRNL